MKKINLYISLWTIVIAAPFVAAAIVIDGYVITHLTSLINAFVEFMLTPTRIGRPLVIEITERLPEVAGMAAGMLVIMITVWLARLQKADVPNK